MSYENTNGDPHHAMSTQSASSAEQSQSSIFSCAPGESGGSSETSATSAGSDYLVSSTVSSGDGSLLEIDVGAQTADDGLVAADVTLDPVLSSGSLLQFAGTEGGSAHDGGILSLRIGPTPQA